MNKQGHDNRPISTGQREPEVGLSVLFPQGTPSAKERVALSLFLYHV